MDFVSDFENKCTIAPRSKPDGRPIFEKLKPRNLTKEFAKMTIQDKNEKMEF